MARCSGASTTRCGEAEHGRRPGTIEQSLACCALPCCDVRDLLKSDGTIFRLMLVMWVQTLLSCLSENYVLLSCSDLLKRPCACETFSKDYAMHSRCTYSVRVEAPNCLFVVFWNLLISEAAPRSLNSWECPRYSRLRGCGHETNEAVHWRQWTFLCLNPKPSTLNPKP